MWDCGNGAAGEIAARLTGRLSGTHRLLYAEIDGSFPNHHPDPTVAANLADLQAAVARDGADVGIAFDGDGDRIGIVDDRGAILWADQAMLYFAADLLGTGRARGSSPTSRRAGSFSTRWPGSAARPKCTGPAIPSSKTGCGKPARRWPAR